MCTVKDHVCTVYASEMKKKINELLKHKRFIIEYM